MSPVSEDVIGRALRMAAVAHAGQTRKGSGVPYLTHPVEVSRVLREHGFDETQSSLHAAALLHDAVEDTPVTVDDVRAEFPDDVAEWVSWLSEVKQGPAGETLPWKTRKSEHIARLRAAPWQACALELADKIHNLRDILSEPRSAEYWEIFNARPAELVWYYRTMIEASTREGEVASLVRTARELVDRLERVVAGVVERS